MTVRTRQWAPVFVLLCVVVASWMGYDSTAHDPSWSAALVGLIFGLTVVVMVHFGTPRR